jgi:pyridoxamine 5'-phosphate oxidase
MDLSDRRRQYGKFTLSEEHVAADPIHQFQHWLRDAEGADILEPNAMNLATASMDAIPSGRMVLLKGFDHRGFVFFTNHQSRKGRDLAENLRAALTFYWDRLERQVRVEGRVEHLCTCESDKYFESRPRESQRAALASPQSEPIESRERLEGRMQEVEAEYEGRDIPRPPHWGGYRVIPVAVEFWQGRENRLHDRLRYTRQTDGAWLIERLAP